jgi:hypothetical protein
MQAFRFIAFIIVVKFLLPPVGSAVITGTGQTADAPLTVVSNQLAGEVTVTAGGAFTRTYTWTIDKTVTPTSLNLQLNQQVPVNYQVTVDETSTDSPYLVTGTITITNPFPDEDMTVTDVTGSIDTVPETPATVTCPSNMVNAGGTLVCTYTATLTAPDPGTSSVTVTATVPDLEFPEGTPPGTDSTVTFSGTADFTFLRTEVDTYVDVSDTLAGTLGRVYVSDGTPPPKTFSFSGLVGLYQTCGGYTVDNTATFTTNDQGRTGSGSASVAITVPCGGCSQTLGYWKNHAGFGPQDDMVTPLLPQLLGPFGGLKTQTVSTPALAVQFLRFDGSNNVFDASNGVNKLYAQELAAKLDIANGADGSAIASTITSADAFLATHDSTSWATLGKTDKNLVNSWVKTLDSYNTGLIGPGHCST